MGIDQVLVIPTTILGHLPYVESPEGAVAFCRAYNDWVADWCAEVPDRLFGAALLPLQDPLAAAREVERVAARGLPVALVRPIDARGGYPNQIGPYLLAQVAMTSPKYAEALDKTFDVVFRAIEDTGVCLGMHTFPEFRSGRTRHPV
jgi:predicted TIM-barrel fold metal-dependent hydrolase